jgi:hypothetical protein
VENCVYIRETHAISSRYSAAHGIGFLNHSAFVRRDKRFNCRKNGTMHCHEEQEG